MAQQEFGYAAMLEQFNPRDLLEYCVAAEANGFSGVMAADHLQPWVPQQGNAAFVWAFMAAVAERTKGDVGPGVTCPSFRTHPVVIAQAAATMAACTRAVSGSDWAAARRSTSTSWPTTGPRRPNAST